MNTLRRLTALMVAVACTALGAGVASADRIDPLSPTGPLAFSTTLQNTPEGASSRIAFRSGDATIVNSGVWGGRKLVASGAGEAYLLADGKGPEGHVTSIDIETGWYLTCAVKLDGVDLGAIGGYVQAGPIPAGGLLLFPNIKLAPGQYTKIKLGEKHNSGPIDVGQRIGVRYQRAEMTVNGCIGNTYAYPYVTYTSSTDAFDNTKTLIGQTVYLAF